MRTIAERYISKLENSQPMSNAEMIAKAKYFHKRYSVLLFLCALSVLLYTGLYIFNAEIIAMTKGIYQGSKGLFFVPILVALVFSVVHGAFTSKFWDVLGVKAKG